MKEINVDIGFIRRVYGNKAVANNGLCLFLDSRSSVTCSPYRIKNLCCFFCLNGEIDVLINGEKQHIQAPAFVTYLPESIVEEKFISPDFRCAVIVFDSSIMLSLPIPELPDLLIYAISHPVFPLHNVSEEQILCAWKSFHIIAESESPYRQQCLEHLIAMTVYHPFSTLSQMVSYEITRPDVLNTDPDGQLVCRCVVLIKEHYTKERFVDFYATQSHVTPMALNAAFKKCLGCSVMEYIHRMIMRRASILLMTSTASVTEIAYILNFKAPSHFVNFFKKRKGVTPDKFRHDKQYWNNIDD